MKTPFSAMKFYVLQIWNGVRRVSVELIEIKMQQICRQIKI